MSQGLKRAAVFCILRSGDHYLLLRRSSEPNRGKFVPPGGKIDPFETPADAVVREIYEETGLRIPDPKFCGMLTETSPGDYNWVSFIYAAEVHMAEPPPCDEGEFHWIHKGELEDLETPPTDWFIYQYVAACKPFVFSAEYDDNLTMWRMADELEGITVYKP